MTKPTGRPVGRPSKYSEALGDRICEAMIDGRDLMAICAQPGFPDRKSALVPYPMSIRQCEVLR